MKKIIFSLLFALILAFTASAQTYTLQDKWVSCGNGVELLDPYYSDGVTFTWTGASRNGKANGTGVATKYLNGKFESKYEGSYKNGIREGRGTFTHADGSVKTGNFVNGQLMGHGTMIDDDGNSYDGNFINYRMHGNGKLRLANGTTFEGFFVSDEPYTGKLTYYTGDAINIQAGEPVEIINEPRPSYSPKIGQRITEYFDENWKRCEPRQASYYRLITYSAPNRPEGVVKDYYISGELQSEFHPIYIDYADEGKMFLEGEQVFYHKNGKVERKTYFYNNQPNGPMLSYYPDGSKQSESFFVMGVPQGNAITYFQNGKVQSIAKYENGSLYKNKYLQFTEDGMSFLIYNEDFEKDSEAWEYSGQNGVLQVNKDNTITLNVSPGRSLSGGIYTGFAPMSDNMISIITRQRQPKAGTIMLLFGFKDWKNYCALAIRGNEYQFIYIKNGVTVEGGNPKYSAAIKPDVNELQVVNNGDKITLLINDTPVEEFGRIYYDGSLCGISVQNDSYDVIAVDAAQLAVQEVVDSNKIPSEFLPSRTTPGGWTGNGSGFFVNEAGYIATNYHVVDGTTALQVTFTRNGEAESYPAQVILSDKDNDLAIIKITDNSYSPVTTIPYGLETDLKDTGSEVFALGFPMADVMGEEIKYTDGKISSRSGFRGERNTYQISVPIQHGNSGGPLFDDNCNIVGITSSGIDCSVATNVNYAIKASILSDLLNNSPVDINLPKGRTPSMSDLSLVDKIKRLEGYVVLIKTK